MRSSCLLPVSNFSSGFRLEIIVRYTLGLSKTRFMMSRNILSTAEKTFASWGHCRAISALPKMDSRYIQFRWNSNHMSNARFMYLMSSSHFSALIRRAPVQNREETTVDTMTPESSKWVMMSSTEPKVYMSLIFSYGFVMNSTGRISPPPAQIFVTFISRSSNAASCVAVLLICWISSIRSATFSSSSTPSVNSGSCDSSRPTISSIAFMWCSFSTGLRMACTTGTVSLKSSTNALSCATTGLSGRPL
mmetsp:Transcript_46775/g.83844  ORF Transcript_46775/g.83844 Transcript_46775/m.83844 type:complete len:248 (+) Transcript_46775:8950-9693(+)